MTNPRKQPPMPKEIKLQHEKEPAPPKSEVSSDLVDRRITALLERVKEEPALAAVNALPEAIPNTQVYLVGGSVRDAIVQGQSKDYDFVVRGASVDELVKYFNQHGKAKLVAEKRFGVIKFHPTGSTEEIDIALPRTEVSTGTGYLDFKIEPDQNMPVEEDLGRRDFTFNAMALDITSGRLVDPHNGKEDLLNGVVRAVGDPHKRFEEDLSRTLRALRFAIKYNFSIEEKTDQAIKQKSSRINEKTEDDEWVVSREKIGVEFLKMLEADPVRTLDNLKEAGFLREVFPEIDRLSVIQQYKEYHPEGDVYVHMRIVLEKLPPDASLELKLAALFHDLGKYTAVQVKFLRAGPNPYDSRRTILKGMLAPIEDPEAFFTDGRYDPEIHQVQNLGHEEESLRIANELITRFALQSKEPGRSVDWGRVRYNVLNHMLIGVESTRMHAVEQILFDNHNLPRWDLVMLADADKMTESGISRADIAREKIQALLEIYERRRNEPPTIITRKIMKEIVNHPPFKKQGLRYEMIGALKAALREEELEGRIHSEEDMWTLARAFVALNATKQSQ